MNRTAEFFRREYQKLVGYVRRRIDEAAGQEAEDIVQDVIIGLLNRADPTLPIQDLAAFVYRALRNRIIDRFRKRRETLALREDIAGSGEDPFVDLERKEILEALFSAMDGLTSEERAVILATELEGRTFKELAGEWRIPLGTLLARKSRALGKLRTRLSDRTSFHQGAKP